MNYITGAGDGVFNFKSSEILGKNGKKSDFGYISAKSAMGNKQEKSAFI